LKRNWAAAVLLAAAFILMATTSPVVVVPMFAPRMMGIASAGVNRPLWAMTTTRPAVTELDWNMLVMTKPIAIPMRTFSAMERRAMISGSPWRGAISAEIMFRQKKTRPK